MSSKREGASAPSSAEWEEPKWEQCRIVYEAVTSGEYTRRSLAHAIGISPQVIGIRFRMWEEWGSTPPEDRPRWSEAYTLARRVRNPRS
jgi:hypothetical protein